ncbi:MAG TPA: BON domain-containing protein [Bryobacteraceae bacterium]|nr:BON domain-containing protein [Bryobacteraceae bacterium]
MKRLMNGMVLGAAILAAQSGFAAIPASDTAMAKTEQQVRKEILMLPNYNVFDTFSFRLDGDTVTLMGKVTRPALKTDAENAVKRVEGITTVDNRIEVLPLSPNDDRLRLSLYRAIYGHSALETLAVRAVPPIHLIVENGHATLEGAVPNAAAKSIAELQANGVAGVFSVTNKLLVESES